MLFKVIDVPISSRIKTQHFSGTSIILVRTKKKEFLAQMDRIIPWGEWKALIQPYYYKGERGNKPYELELMLVWFLLQIGSDFSDRIWFVTPDIIWSGTPDANNEFFFKPPAYNGSNMKTRA